MVLESRTRTGQRGEAWAIQALSTPSRQLLATNWRWHRHEIDAVFMELDTVVFLEVKSRTGCGRSTLGPMHMPSTAQQQRIVRAAHAFMKRHRLRTTACRFDLAVVCFHRRDGSVLDFTHVQGAFDGTQALLPAARRPNWRSMP